ncbi:MAG: LemA family protein [Clostridia bacterium]|nr:LemA family protein [Clostridia bacterium]MDD4387162.1 LemA family protein [Clostridia bacterium]
MTGFIILGIVVLVILIVIFIYNNLVSLKLRVQNAWAQIDTQLKRRFDLIPNLVETVKGYAAHEQGTFEKIVEARNSYTNATTVAGKSEANNMLSDTLKSIFALAESYPDLKANQNFAALQVELASTEDKVAYSRQFYNDTVQMYNTAIMTFPSNILAGMFNFKEEVFFEIADVKEREAVKVQF